MEEQIRSLHTYSCPACGAEFAGLCEVEVCAYCGSTSIVRRKAEDRWQPDCILPFRVSEDAAVRGFRTFCEQDGRAPGRFRRERFLRTAQPIYVPCWLYSGRIHVALTFEGQRPTENDLIGLYNLQREGRIDYRDVPANGSSRLENELLEALEPFDTGACEPFSLELLGDRLIDRSDVPTGKRDRQADERALAAVQAVMEDTTEGFSAVRTLSRDVEYADGELRCALLPVWVLCARQKGRHYLLLQNGRTGKVSGALPRAGAPLWLWPLLGTLFAGAAYLAEFFLLKL